MRYSVFFIVTKTRLRKKKKENKEKIEKKAKEKMSLCRICDIEKDEMKSEEMKKLLLYIF